MGLCVIEQRDALLRGIKRDSVELDSGDPVRNAARVLDGDFIARSAMAVAHSKGGPAWRDARVEEEQFAAFAHAEDAFESGTIHPSGRAGIPGPAAAPDMGRFRIDVG